MLVVTLPLFEVARVLVRFGHVAGIFMRAAAMLRVSSGVADCVFRPPYRRRPTAAATTLKRNLAIWHEVKLA